MININDNISIVFSSSALDLISNTAMIISGGGNSLITVDSDIGPSVIIKSNQYLSLSSTNVFSKIQQKGSMSFWVKFPQIAAGKSVPIAGIGTQALRSGQSIPDIGFFYCYINSDEDAIMRFYISMHGSDGSINVFSHGPVEPFIINSVIISYDLSQGILSMYLDGAVADLVYEPGSSIPSALSYDSSLNLFINRFSGSSLSNIQSGGFEISDLMIYSDFISDISDVASIINDGSYDFLRRKSGNAQGEIPQIVPAGIADSLQKGRINDSASTSFGVIAGLEDGSVILGTEKSWQRRIFFGDTEELGRMKISKTSNNYEVVINPEGSLSLRGANLKVL